MPVLPADRAKGAYWPESDAPPARRLLHPLKDYIDEHLSLLDNGMLEGITDRGRFHIAWLQLNRPQLVQHRQEQQQRRLFEQVTQATIERQQQMQQQIDQTQTELKQLYVLIERLRQTLQM